MTFSIIGTGNIAWFLSTRLVAAHHQCTAVYGRNSDRAAALAGYLGAPASTIGEGISDGASDICFLVVSDQAIPEIASKLSFRDTVLVHTAGAVPIDVLHQAALHSAVFWPVYSILKNNLPAHHNVPCAWEASDDAARELLLQAAAAVTDILFEARYEQRKWLHLGAVIGNNFSNHLMAICEQLCAEHQLPFTFLLPIIEQTFERIQHASPAALQTGPAQRNDSGTMNAQLELLKNHPLWQTIYEAVSASIRHQQGSPTGF